MYEYLLSALTLLLPLYLIYRPPRILIRILQKKYPDVLFHRPTNDKIIALTIDDAPSCFTPDILSTLSRYDAKATFFCIGTNMQGNEEILRDIVRAGHELGNHAMYDERSFTRNVTELSAQITTVDDMIRSIYDSLHQSDGYPPRYFRPGSGFFTAAMRRLASSLGYRIVLGSIYPHDPQIHSATLNSLHITTMADRGGIVIIHDGRAHTMETLERALPKLRDMGYCIVTVSELVDSTGGGPDFRRDSEDVVNVMFARELEADAP